MSDLITTTRATVKRGWTEFEPKVITGLLSGSVGAALISILPDLGIHVTDAMRNFIIVGCYFLGSYLTPSSGMVITTQSDRGAVVTKTTGHTVTTATNSIPVQAAPVPVPVKSAPDVPLADLLHHTSDAIPDVTTEAATAIIPPADPYANPYNTYRS